MKGINRREFLKGGSAALAALMLPRGLKNAVMLASEPLPAPLGRIINWRQALRKEASAQSELVEWKTRDEIIPLQAAVVGEAPWPSNPIWYQTEGGFIHSGYVQPVENNPQHEVVKELNDPGFWAQVCVPIAESRWSPSSPYIARKLYYGTVYRVVQTTEDDEGNWWYQLKEGIAWSPGPYVPASSLQHITPTDLLPISRGCPDKWIEINIPEQTLSCIEGKHIIFRTPIASGVWGMGTPLGEFNVLYKRHTRRMIGADYDLAGVAFPVYFTWSGVAIHGTYWHNDFGRRHSHGCINVSNYAAQWIFRWVDPPAAYEDYTQKAEPGKGTRVVVI